MTGAASGIGEALAIAFYNASAKNILVSDIDTTGAKETAEKINGTAITTDVTKEEDVKKMINLYEHDIDIYCSNVGIGSYEDFLKLTNEQWKNMIDTNLMSHIYGVRHVLPKMLDRGSGHLVFTASAAGLLSQLGSVTYSVTKHAVVSLAEWLKITYGKLGIGVSCICPQAVRTAMTAQGAGVAGIDGMIEPDVVANDTLEAIQNDQFLVTPHKEVREYIQFKAADYEGWIEGMQNLQEQYIDEIKSVIK
ncbi:MAG: SDR family oxidoreductase [Candidatus Marinimicrobia bacterium]|nr:SDR family oxidoreductase [Candidatus Neomarinimicrobiota bacterium]